MTTRTLARWTLSIGLTLIALVGLNLLLANAPVQARHAAGLINCSGSIQACIDAASDGDTILIAAGHYTESLTLNKPVSLTGVNRDTTILHAVEGQRVLTITGATISNSVVISGLTFTGGSTDYGGGVLITDTAQPLIRNSIFISNAANANGGGIHAQSALTLLDSQIISNTAAELGGGVFAAQSLTITNSEFIGNSTIGPWPTYFPHGGGIYAQMNVFIAKGRFAHNSSFYGGGLFTVGPLLTLIDTDFISNAEGGAIALRSSDTSETRISGGHFSGNSGYSGLEVAGPLVITGTQFVGNTGSSYSAGLSIDDGPATITNSRFEDNHCTSDCYVGGLSFYNYSVGTSPLLISNTVFISNFPGAVGVNRGQATVINSRFERNAGAYAGSGLYLEYSPVTVIGTQFISNTASYGGGGGLTLVMGEAKVIDSYFEGNTSPHFGGGIQIRAGVAYFTNTQFINNAASAGGGAFAEEAYITNGRFERNTAKNDGIGGGLCGGDFYISGTHFVSNTADDNGGGVSAAGVTMLTNVRMENNQVTTGGGGGVQTNLLVITDSQILSNTAAQGGGAIVFDGGRIVNTIFAGNRAISNGATIALTVAPYGPGPGRLELLHTTIADTILNPQPAIAVLTGTLYLTDTIMASHTIAISNTGGTVYEDYNLFFGNITNTLGVTNGGHSLSGDPKFVDPLHGDYHLQSGSPAIDHGIDAGVCTDLDGHSRFSGTGFDMGAYEYQSSHYLWLPLIKKEN